MTVTLTPNPNPGPSGDRANGDPARSGGSAGDRARSDRQGNGSDRASRDRPSSDQSSSDRTRSDRASGDRAGTATPTPAPLVPTARAARRRRLTFTRVVRAEWLKLLTLRSTLITLGSTMLMVVGFGLIAASAVGEPAETAAAAPGGPGVTGGDPLTTVLAGVDIAVLLVGVFGALAGAREYSSGLIRTTLAAVPRRLPVLWSRALVVIGLVLPTALVSVLLAFVGGNEILAAGGHETVSFADDGVLRALLGEAAYLTAVALIGLGLGVLFRSATASIGTVVAGFLILPNLATLLLPESWADALMYLPSKAGEALTAVTESDALLSPTAGGVLLLGWVVAIVAGAAVALRTRDV